MIETLLAVATLINAFVALVAFVYGVIHLTRVILKRRKLAKDNKLKEARIKDDLYKAYLLSKECKVYEKKN